MALLQHSVYHYIQEKSESMVLGKLLYSSSHIARPINLPRSVYVACVMWILVTILKPDKDHLYVCISMMLSIGLFLLT